MLFRSDNLNGRDYYDGWDEDEDEDEEMAFDEEDNGSEEALPKPIFDDHDNVLRCSECNWEVIEGQCQSYTCAQEHAFAEVWFPLVV